MSKTKTIFDQLKKLHPQAIILFGSSARGEAKEDSDVDILMIQDTKKPFVDRIREVRLALRTHTPLDIIILTPDEARRIPQKSSFFAQIFKEGRVIYGRI